MIKNKHKETSGSLFYQNLLYIHHKMGMTEVVFETFEKLFNQSNLTTIKKACKRCLIDYDSRIEFTKKMLNIKSKVPIYIQSSLLLIPSKSPRRYDTVWINYYAIRDMYLKNEDTVIVFKNLTTLKIDISIKSLKKAITHCENIIHYLTKRQRNLVSVFSE